MCFKPFHVFYQLFSVRLLPRTNFLLQTQLTKTQHHYLVLPAKTNLLHTRSCTRIDCNWVHKMNDFRHKIRPLLVPFWCKRWWMLPNAHRVTLMRVCCSYWRKLHLGGWKDAFSSIFLVASSFLDMIWNEGHYVQVFRVV